MRKPRTRITNQAWPTIVICLLLNLAFEPVPPPRTSRENPVIIARNPTKVKAPIKSGVRYTV